ncbi:hypothetical protein TNCV_1590421 [Trichonephila clavipes]|nr:hypothetical protein TNCV_1590421 [Trichonephila clavipes]
MYSAFVAGGTLNSRQAANPLGKLMEGEERWEAPDHLQGVLPENWGGTEPNVLSPVWCSKLRLTTGVHLALYGDGFHGSQSDNVRKVA